MFTYLSSKMTTDGDTESEMNARLSKAEEADECYGLGRTERQEEVAVSGNDLMHKMARKALS